LPRRIVKGTKARAIWTFGKNGSFDERIFASSFELHYAGTYTLHLNSAKIVISKNTVRHADGSIHSFPGLTMVMAIRWANPNKFQGNIRYANSEVFTRLTAPHGLASDRKVLKHSRSVFKSVGS
jgi:hypothetical protein